MKALINAFLELDSATGILLIVAAVAFVGLVALIVSRISFRAGQRAAQSRQVHFNTKRRELASIQL